MMRSRFTFHTIGFLALFSLASACFAQSSALLRGAIVDPTGAYVVDAVVTLTNAETGLKRQVLSNANGEYQFLQVVPGTYKVVVEKPGFSVATRANVALLVNTPSTLDMHLELGKTEDVVNVTAEASVVNTVDASVGNTFSELQVRQLPLQTRNVVE